MHCIVIIIILLNQQLLMRHNMGTITRVHACSTSLAAKCHDDLPFANLLVESALLSASICCYQEFKSGLMEAATKASLLVIIVMALVSICGLLAR